MSMRITAVGHGWAAMCTDAEWGSIRAWRGWIGGGIWYADATRDDVAHYHNCNCGGYWYNDDGEETSGMVVATIAVDVVRLCRSWGNSRYA